MNLNIVFKKLEENAEETAQIAAIGEEARRIGLEAPELDELRRLAEWSEVAEPESYTVT